MCFSGIEISTKEKDSILMASQLISIRFYYLSQKGNLVLIETKGDDRVNDDSLMK